MTSPDNTPKSGNREGSTHTHTHTHTHTQQQGAKQETTVSDSRASEVAWQSRDTHSSLPSRLKKIKNPLRFSDGTRRSLLPSPPPHPPHPSSPTWVSFTWHCIQIGHEDNGPGLNPICPVSRTIQRSVKSSYCCSIFELSQQGQTE